MTADIVELQAARERAARRRALARLHHPDLGGDAEAFVRAMAAFEAQRSTDAVVVSLVEDVAPVEEIADAASAPRMAITVVERSAPRRALRRMARRTSDAAAALRVRLPRRAPGSRRYARL